MPATRPPVLTLGLRRPGADAGLEPAMRDEVLAQARWQCAFCGFSTRAGGEVVPGPQGRPIPACALCAACRDLAGTIQRGAGRLIYLPEIGQSDLNCTCRAIFMVLVRQHAGYRESAIALYKSLYNQTGASAPLKRICGDPQDVVTVLKTMSAKDYETLMESEDSVFSGLRLLAIARPYEALVRQWAMDPAYDIEAWERLRASQAQLAHAAS